MSTVLPTTAVLPTSTVLICPCSTHYVACRAYVAILAHAHVVHAHAHPYAHAYVLVYCGPPAELTCLRRAAPYQ